MNLTKGTHVNHDSSRTIEDRKTLGQYPTPGWVAQALVERHFAQLSSTDKVVEPSCGPGSFLSVIPSDVFAVGVEIDPVQAALARANTQRTVLEGDFCEVQLGFEPSLVLGNPPFKLALIDRFLQKAFDLLPYSGQVGFVLPAYTFQTAARVARYASQWSLYQEMIPRNIYPGLKLPLVFAIFAKERYRRLVGFALYNEATEVLAMSKQTQQSLNSPKGPVWVTAVRHALSQLGGQAKLSEIYEMLEPARPTQTEWWKEKVRQTLRRYHDAFVPVGNGVFKLSSI